MNYAFLLAGGASAFALAIHLLLGRSRSLLPPTPEAGRDPLLDADAWFGRHVTTLALAGMTLGFATASRQADARDLASALTAFALLLALMRFAIAARMRSPRFDIAEWGLIAVAGVLGEIGLLAS